MKFDFSGVAMDRWYMDDQVETHFYNAFFIIIPAYERLVITVMGRSALGLTDAEFKKGVRRFAREESAHSKEHDRFNRALASGGYPAVATLDRLHQWIVHRMLHDWSLRLLQSITAFGELMTAAMCGAYLRRRSESLAKTDARVDEFWTWHSEEEMEHRTLCFDVFAALSKGGAAPYGLKMLGVAMGTPFFQSIIFFNHLYLLAADGCLLQRRTLASLRKVWSRHLRELAKVAVAYARRCSVPWRAI